MKKIKSYLKQNYKRLIIQVVSIVSALVIFTVPAFATEYGLEWLFYDGGGSGSVHPGGVFFYLYNYNSGEYVYYPTSNVFNGVYFRGTSVDPKYTTVAVISNQPVDTSKFQEIFNGSVNEKFYIEFPIYLEFGTDNKGDFIDPVNLYLSSVDFLANEDGSISKYSVQLDKDSSAIEYDLANLRYNVGFTIIPNGKILDISQVSFNFSVPKQNVKYYVQFRPAGSIIIKTGDNIPSYAPVTSDPINNLDSVEQELQDKTQAGVNEADKIFDNAGNIFSKTNVVGTSVMAATKIFNALLKTDVFNDILNVALVLGIFAFLLGLGGVGASLWNKHEDTKYDSISSDDERWLY